MQRSPCEQSSINTNTKIECSNYVCLFIHSVRLQNRVKSAFLKKGPNFTLTQFFEKTFYSQPSPQIHTIATFDRTMLLAWPVRHVIAPITIHRKKVMNVQLQPTHRLRAHSINEVNLLKVSVSKGPEVRELNRTKEKNFSFTQTRMNKIAPTMLITCFACVQNKAKAHKYIVYAVLARTYEHAYYKACSLH